MTNSTPVSGNDKVSGNDVVEAIDTLLKAPEEKAIPKEVMEEGFIMLKGDTERKGAHVCVHCSGNFVAEAVIGLSLKLKEDNPLRFAMVMMHLMEGVMGDLEGE